MIQPGFLLGINPGLRPVFTQNFYFDPFDIPSGIHPGFFLGFLPGFFPVFFLGFTRDSSRNSSGIPSQTSPGNPPRINSKFSPGLFLEHLSGFTRNSSRDSFQCSPGIYWGFFPEFFQRFTFPFSPLIHPGFTITNGIHL